MIDLLTQQVGQDLMGHGVLIFLRVGAFFFFVPLFGASTVSIRIKLGLALVCAMMVAPLVPVNEILLENRSSFLVACASECFSGLLVGFACRATFWCVQLAGTMAAQAISLSQVLGNQVEQPSPAFGQIAYVAALALAAILGFHVLVVKAIALSFELIELGRPVSENVLEHLSVSAVAKLFYLAFGLAGPFLVIAVLYNLCLGIVNKAMPQLMVAFVGAPAVTWMGIFALYIAVPVMLSTWKEELQSLSFIFGGVDG